MIANHPMKQHQNDENSFKCRSNTFSKKAILNFMKDELCHKAVKFVSNLPE